MRKLHLYWWSFNELDKKDNYGDILSPYIVCKLSKKEIVKVKHPSMRKYSWYLKHYLAIGSIMSHAQENSVIWGSGIIKRNEKVKKAKFLAVRGPKTRERLLELGYKVPEIYGDPAILLPNFINDNVTKKYEFGIVPHYVDYDDVFNRHKNDERIKVIDLLTNDIEKTTKEILECRNIIASSLHGLIVGHAYRIPSLWVKFSNKLAGDDIKFFDYLESMNINYSETITLKPEEDFNYDTFNRIFRKHQLVVSADQDILKKRQEEILKACPFYQK